MCNREAATGERRSTIAARDMRMFPIPILSRTENMIATSRELDISISNSFLGKSGKSTPDKPDAIYI
jgi:hypothetical protein